MNTQHAQQQKQQQKQQKRRHFQRTVGKINKNARETSSVSFGFGLARAGRQAGRLRIGSLIEGEGCSIWFLIKQITRWETVRIRRGNTLLGLIECSQCNRRFALCFCLSLSFSKFSMGRERKGVFGLGRKKENCRILGRYFAKFFGACNRAETRRIQRERKREREGGAQAQQQHKALSLLRSLSLFVSHSPSRLALHKVFNPPPSLLLPLCCFQFHCDCCPDFWASKLCRSYVSLALHQGSPYPPPHTPLY